MTTQVIDLFGTPPETSRRRLADLPDRVLEGDPRHESGTHFTSPDGQLTVGVWTSTPGRWRAFTDKDEYCFIVSGRCALIHEDGTRQEFGAMCAFLCSEKAGFIVGQNILVDGGGTNATI